MVLGDRSPRVNLFRIGPIVHEEPEFDPRGCDHLAISPGECDHLAISFECAHVYIPESYGYTNGLLKLYSNGTMRLPGILGYVCFIVLGTMGLPGILF